MNPKFHERFDINVGVEEARRRFRNRVKNLIYQSFLHDMFGYDTDCKNVIRHVVSKLGDEYNYSIPLEKHIGDDFFKNLQAVEAMHSVIATPYKISLVKLVRSEEHTSELQSRLHLVCRLL